MFHDLTLHNSFFKNLAKEFFYIFVEPVNQIFLLSYTDFKSVCREFTMQSSILKNEGRS